jgi:hypothetical protein
VYTHSRLEVNTLAKPRTNADAASYWAEGILSREPQPHITVNSVHVEGDWIYSFGHHFPMGVIERTEGGRVRRVLINHDSYTGPSGWANTGADQSSVAHAARDAISRASWKIELASVYLSTYALGGQRGQIPVIPREGDPEPPWPYLEIPTYFFRRDPGPEPVQDRTNCIAGREEVYEYQEDVYLLLAREPQPQDFTLYHRYKIDGEWTNGHQLYARRSFVGRIVWGESRHAWEHYEYKGTPAGVEYKQCPCCKVFQDEHQRWSERMHGHRWSRDHNAQYGYEHYVEYIGQFGTERAWREARREDWRRVQRGRKAHREWVERNFIPLSAVSRGKYSVPKLAPGGYALRKDEYAYFQAKRDAERRERRRQREREAHERYLRQLDRFKRGVRRRRKPSFEQRAIALAAELASMREHIMSNPERQLEEPTHG